MYVHDRSSYKETYKLPHKYLIQIRMYIVLTCSNLIATTRKPTRFIFIISSLLQHISLFNLYYRVVMHIACSVLSIQNDITTLKERMGWLNMYLSMSLF